MKKIAITGMTERMAEYVLKRNELLEKEKQEIVSNCCSAKVHDYDMNICPECKEPCEYVDLNKTKS